MTDSHCTLAPGGLIVGRRVKAVVNLLVLTSLLLAFPASHAQAHDAERQPPLEKLPTLELELLPLKGSYADFPQPLQLDPSSLLLGGSVQQKSFYKLCDYLERLADKDETGPWVVLDMSDGSLSLNLAQSGEFIRRFEAVKKNKKTVAWLTDASAGQLAIASQCDEVILADFGSIDLPSVGMEQLFFKDAMDLVGVQASVVRAGDFKGAVEPYTNSRMSSHLRDHNLKMLTALNNARVQQIARGRGLKPAAVRKLQAKRFLTAKEALKAGLVDRLAPYGSMKQTVAAMTERDDIRWNTPKTKPKKKMSFFELMGEIMSGPKKKSSDADSTSIAVLHLSGMIVNGAKTRSGAMVSGPTVKAIQQLIDDDQVKAVVIRINSPGGSATASEEIRQQLIKLADAKPTVVSMGDMAASGGYWISCLGVPIYAEEGTVTGSIGVFSMKVSMGALARRIGVHVESITLDDSAAAFSMGRPFTDAEKQTFQKHVDAVYDRFLGLVAKSRKMKVAKVKPLAGGRVWAGAQAKKLGLVDKLGGVDDCVRQLAEKAKLKEYEVIHRPLQPDGLALFDLLGGDGGEEILQFASPQAIGLLRRQGFPIDHTLQLLRDAVGDRPRAGISTWLMRPATLRIR